MLPVSVADKVKVKLSLTFWLLNPGCCQYSIPGHIMPFWHMASQKDGSVSMPAYWVFGWTNIQQIMKHKAEEKVGAVYSSILSPLLLLATCRLLQTVGKYLMEALIQNRCRRRREGRAGRFVSNRFGQNVSPISRFASVWLPLAKLGEQRNSMNMLSQGSVGWEFEFQQHQPTAYSCNIYAPALDKKKWRKMCTINGQEAEFQLQESCQCKQKEFT